MCICIPIYYWIDFITAIHLHNLWTLNDISFNQFGSSWKYSHKKNTINCLGTFHLNDFSNANIKKIRFHSTMLDIYFYFAFQFHHDIDIIYLISFKCTHFKVIFYNLIETKITLTYVISCFFRCQYHFYLNKRFSIESESQLLTSFQRFHNFIFFFLLLCSCQCI